MNRVRQTGARHLGLNLLRYIALPGTDIFTRRRTELEQHWLKGARKVLDAGFGNGWFSYRAYKSGATVTALAIGPGLVRKATALYNDFLGIPEDRLAFRELNLRDAGRLDGCFDEIICYETLEHVGDDEAVCRTFWQLLRPGGVLHLCCPNSQHPRWQREKLDAFENGGHVRHGYTESDFCRLLEPIGFGIDCSEGVGGPLLVLLQERVQAPLRRMLGETGAALAAAAAVPFVAFDKASPSLPFSIYVRAVRTP